MGKPSKDTRTPLPLLRLRRVTERERRPSKIRGIQRVKPAVVQGQGVGVLQVGQGRRPVQQSVPQQQGGTALPLGEHQLVVLEPLPPPPGDSGSRCGPPGRRATAPPRVGHRHRRGKTRVGQPLLHRQPEGIGIQRQGLGALPQLQAHPVLPPRRRGELPPPGKAVALHGVFPAVKADLSLLQRPHNGKQQGIAPLARRPGPPQMYSSPRSSR